MSVISASLSIERSAYVIELRLCHLSVRTCEQWRHGRLDMDAVWGGEWGWARYGFIRFWWWSSKGRGSLGGEYNAEMAYWSIIDSCLKSWQYFPTQNVSLNSVKDWLSYDVVRFKIELGVEEKFMYRSITKQTQHGDTPVAGSHFAAAQHTAAYIRRTDAYAESPSRAESDSARLGD